LEALRFIHCADLHIDTPFKGVANVNTDLRDLLYGSTFQSYCNIVELAISEKVDCVIISGDVYDSANKSLQAQFRFRNGLRRLSENGISTFVVSGNHDPEDSWSATLEPVERVHVFRSDEVESYPVVRNGDTIAQVHGISFARRDTFENLALRFESVEASVPRIGVLHANLGTNTGHLPYAPCTVEDLSGRAFDYWALGHVHTHSIVKGAQPAIVYPGCSQSTSSRETGAKGCCLVTIELGADPDIQFIPTDIVRYASTDMDISACGTVDDVLSSIKEECEKVSSQLDQRHAIIRLTLTGRTELRAELHRGSAVEDLTEAVREHFEGRSPVIWLERLVMDTAVTYDLADLRSGNDFIADLVSIYDELQDPESEHWEDIQKRLDALFADWQGRQLLERPSTEGILGLARRARDLTLDMIVRTD